MDGRIFFESKKEVVVDGKIRRRVVFGRDGLGGEAVVFFVLGLGGWLLFGLFLRVRWFVCLWCSDLCSCENGDG